MEHARGEALWLVLDHAHVPALGSEADPFDYGGQDRLSLDEPNTALPTAGPCPARLLDGLAPPLPPQLLGVDDRVNLACIPPLLLVTYGAE